MLEVKNLVKHYSTKGGVTVKALDDVSVKFPETGMVFLLGRSGSGKSTLLNVSGGLDRPDSGEIIVKGRSSKDFSSKDFDSYRNTCIGFIFQEYNILNEFNVEQNIALALQLQGKPNDKKAVNELLEEVDLKGLGRRKPNTLSGGQKQRVAIARALIKSPEIIMADEPTGALDSNTGRQVLDTLKKLSKTKLVIIVSHDREFAEFYGDRIIELKDGKILSDVTKELSKPKEINENVRVVSEDTISIKNTEEITEEDVKNILSVLKKNKGEAIITASKREMHDVKRACKIDEGGNKEVFADTKTVKVKEYDGNNTNFIKSRLPLSHAFKMGASSLKTKPIRLIFTILLSVVAFTMFGVLATMMSYDSSYSIGMGLKDSVYDNIALNKSYVEKSTTYEVKPNGEKVFDYEWEDDRVALFGVEELNGLNQRGKSHGINYIGVYNFNKSTEPWQTTTLFVEKSLDEYVDNGYHIGRVLGFSDCGEEILRENGFTLLGNYPTSANQVMISKFLAESIKTFGYRKPDGSTVIINSIEDLIGKTLIVQNDRHGQADLVISGIVDTGAIPSKFDALKPLEGSGNGGQGNGSSSSQQGLSDLKAEFNDYISYSLHSVLYTSKDFYQAHEKEFNVSTNSYVYLNGETAHARVIPYYERYDRNGQYNGNFDIYPMQFYTKNITLSSKSDLVAFYTFSSDFSSFAKENTQTFTLEGNDIYVNIYHDLFNYVVAETEYFIQSSLISPDSETLTAFSSASLKIMEKYSEDTERLTENEISAMLKVINMLLNLDLDSEPDEYLKTTQDYIKNILTNVVAGDKLSRETALNLKGFYIVDPSVSSDWNTPFVSPDFISQFAVENDGSNWVTEKTTDYVAPKDAKFNYLITKSQNTLSQVEFMLDSNDQTYSYGMTNMIYHGAKQMTEMVEELSKIFLIVGGIVGLFAGLMLFNFITVSISAKRKEIGILRAVGARGADVFKIFFSESSVIAFICFIISSVAGLFVCRIINNNVGSIVGISLLNYGILHVGLILGISFAVSFLATIIPVYFTAKKPPVESIRAL